MRYIKNMCRSVLKARTSCCVGVRCEVLAWWCQHVLSTSFETKTCDPHGNSLVEID